MVPKIGAVVLQLPTVHKFWLRGIETGLIINYQNIKKDEYIKS